MRGEFVDVQGRRLYYYAAGTRGAGNPIILLHGFPTSGHLWRDVVPLLPAGYRVVVVDLLGFGRSDPPGKADLSLQGHARRVVEFMNVLGITKATVVGHHLGGGVAQALAVESPERVERLALLHSIGFDATVAGLFAVIRAFLTVARALPHSVLHRLIRREMARWYMDPYRGRHSVDQYLRPFAGGGSRVLLRHLSALDPAETSAIAGRLPAIDLPVAVIAGRDDDAVPDSVAVRLARTFSSGTLDFIDDVRHYSPEETPQEVARLIGALLRR